MHQENNHPSQVLMKRFDIKNEEIEKLEDLENEELNNAKIILANEVTKLCHGEVASKTAALTALETFKGAGISANLPTFEVSKNGLNPFS